MCENEIFIALHRRHLLVCVFVTKVLVSVEVPHNFPILPLAVCYMHTNKHVSRSYMGGGVELPLHYSEGRTAIRDWHLMNVSEEAVNGFWPSKYLHCKFRSFVNSYKKHHLVQAFYADNAYCLLSLSYYQHPI